VTPAARRWATAAIGAAALAMVGPRLTAGREMSAGEPFVYTPPEGFVPANDKLTTTLLGEPASGEQIWIYPSVLDKMVPHVALTETKSRGGVDPLSLQQLANGMSELYARSGIAWITVRYEVKRRADGVKVGLIEGECTKAESRFRVVQIVFPDDHGTHIAIASYPLDEAAKWEGPVLGTIETARGVRRLPDPPPSWMFAAWGMVGALLGFLFASVAGRGRRA
jgi:hypothetical protein